MKTTNLHLDLPKWLTILIAGLSCIAVNGLAAPRSEISLAGQWWFQTNGAPASRWKPVKLPADFQSHEDTNFHGIGWYRKSIRALEVPRGCRWLLEFQGAATEAEVWWNGQRLGSHLGGWTPFRFDVTDLIRAAGPGATHELKVRLDEKVGHNTQGFLPIIQPHFGGLWQPVRLLRVPEPYIDDLELLAIGNPDIRQLELRVSSRGTAADPVESLTIRYRLVGTRHWKTTRLDFAQRNPAQGSLRREGAMLVARVPVDLPKLWSLATPNLYDVEIELAATGSESGDRIRTHAAFRSIEAVGEQLRLNGQPLNVRGVLNWGYYPPRLSPDPGEEAFRHDIEFAKSRGFNLMKFCLWIPPKRFLELCDEMGMLVWVEYPTWHPQFTPAHLENLRREYREFFCHDRNHPSVVLRSLTCETGPGADLQVIRSLYDLAHEMIPGAIVEDDSSWIQWNRVTDFYDDHPYGNNHTWVKTLAELRDYARTNALGPKPLVLGEAMAADTWVPRAPYVKDAKAPRPYWFPGAFDSQAKWIDRLRSIVGPGGLRELEPDSLRYAMLMRKYQAETFRREVPDGGYVISVLRDISTASMGLLDYRGKPKWPARDWVWQGDTICLLKTKDDRRSFSAGEDLAGEIWISHFGDKPLDNARLELRVTPADHPRRILMRREVSGLHCLPGTLTKVADLGWPPPDAPRPQHLLIRCELQPINGALANEWPVWVVPKQGSGGTPPVFVHPSFPADTAAELFPDSQPLTGAFANGVVVASRFDDQLVQALEAGGRVLMQPDGQRGSLPLSAHWFLRGGPYVSAHPLTKTVPREMLVELQHFDLASRVVPDVSYLENIDPVLLLWDTHDLRTVKTHGLIFETRAGAGRLLVSAVNHRGASNAGGRWLLDALIKQLATGPAPQHALSADQWARIKEKIHEEKIPLADRAWRFRPDPNNEGLKLGWQARELPLDADWKDIRITTFWESQGYPALDGWAWYRLSVEIPKSWQGRPVYLSFEGVDDAYELYVNGQLAGSGGDIPSRRTAFEERKSHDISAFVNAGENCVIAVRVYDWYGAGGIFRPVTLGTVPVRPDGDLLR